ncbi:MAG: MinD/ParA family protein [Chloroflexi bacterium]|nr:MinD/ParA family protein [Chloroflexota bacterium]
MSKIVSIHSFRGGTGKSNTTANLAAQVALAGKRVGIVDTDIQSPGIHVLFGLDGVSMGHTLNEYLRGEVPIEEVAFNIGDHTGDVSGRVKLAGQALYLFPSSIKGSEISRVLKDGYDANKLNEGLQDMIKTLNLDYLFIDTHPGLNEETLLSISISDILILIMRPDNQDFQGTAVTVDIAKLLLVDHLHLLVNKALSRYDFGHLKAEIEGVFDTPVAAVLPLTEDMVENASGDIFSLAFPDHPWSKGIRQVVDTILKIG